MKLMFSRLNSATMARSTDVTRPPLPPRLSDTATDHPIPGDPGLREAYGRNDGRLTQLYCRLGADAHSVPEKALRRPGQLSMALGRPYRGIERRTVRPPTSDGRGRPRAAAPETTDEC